jgi:hypothetical protein
MVMFVIACALVVCVVEITVSDVSDTDVVVGNAVVGSEDRVEVMVDCVHDVGVVVDGNPHPNRPNVASPARNRNIFVFIRSPAFMDPLYHK